jgi:hypothetical protein
LKLEFEWEVSQGIISEGQGTSSIKVSTTPDMAGSNVTATVKVKGLKSICNKEVSETAIIEEIIDCGLPPDQYSNLSLEDEFMRIDNFLIQILNDPKSKGYIFFEIEKSEDLGDVKKRLTSVFNHIFEKRKINTDLILYDICYAEENQTTFQIIPEGAHLPEKPNCEKAYIDLK